MLLKWFSERAGKGHYQLILKGQYHPDATLDMLTGNQLHITTLMNIAAKVLKIF